MDDSDFLKIIIGSIVAGSVGLIFWLFKGTTTKANNAMALSTELKTRVEKLECTQKEVHDLALSVAEIRAKVDGVDKSLARIEGYMLEDRKKR